MRTSRKDGPAGRSTPSTRRDASDAGAGAPVPKASDRTGPTGAARRLEAPPDAFETLLSGSTESQVRRLLRPFSPERTLLGLDIDGTLAPFVAQANEARVPLNVALSVAQAIALRMHVVIFTGRTPEVARRMLREEAERFTARNPDWHGAFSPILRHEFDIWGLHGAACLRAGESQPWTDPQVAEGAAAVYRFMEGVLSEVRWGSLEVNPRQFTTPSGAQLSLEEKGPILALHWRGVRHGTLSEAFARSVEVKAMANGLGTHRGDKVLEIRPNVPFSKGTALEAELLQSGRSQLILVGDDHTDVEAMDRAAVLREKGALTDSLCVGVLHPGGPHKEMSRVAQLLLRGTNEASEFLAQLVGTTPSR